MQTDKRVCVWLYSLIWTIVESTQSFYFLKCLTLNFKDDNLEKAYLPETLVLVLLPLNYVPLINLTKEISIFLLVKAELIR